MMARSHAVIGAAAWLAAAPMLGQPGLRADVLLLAVIGALLPDVDHPRSWVGRRTRPLSTVIAATLGHRGITHSALAVIGALLPDVDHPRSWVGRRTRPLSTVIAATLGHRGITHSALAVIGMAMLLTAAGLRHGAVAAVGVGYLSHLAADLLTPRGLRLLWPLRGTWGIPLCRTGSPAETLIVLALLGAVAWRLIGRS